MLLVTYTGHGAFQIPAMLLFCLPRATRPYALACVAAFASSGVVRLVVREIVNRQRPSNFSWAQPLEPIYGDSSFPSGHSTTSFAIAFMVAWLVAGKENAWIGWALTAWAALVAFSRVYIGVHYPLDTVAAAALAAACSSACFLVWQKKGWLPGTSGPETP